VSLSRAQMMLSGRMKLSSSIRVRSVKQDEADPGRAERAADDAVDDHERDGVRIGRHQFGVDPLGPLGHVRLLKRRHLRTRPHQRPASIRSLAVWQVVLDRHPRHND
jgi:hypothetical protein